MTKTPDHCDCYDCLYRDGPETPTVAHFVQRGIDARWKRREAVVKLDWRTKRQLRRAIRAAPTIKGAQE